MRHARFSLTHPMWPAVALLAGLILTMTMISAVALSAGQVDPLQVPGGIEGFLYEPDDATPVVGGWIDIHDAEGTPWMGTHTDETGHFTISNLPPGFYTLRAYPPEVSPYAASLEVEVEVFSGQVTPVALSLTEVGISGWVQDCATGARIEGAWVVAHDTAETLWVWDSTNSNGEFKLGGVASGTSYILEAHPPPESEYAPSEPVTVVPVTSSVILELCIPPINVQGVVNDPIGDPVDGAWVVIWNEAHWEETGAELGNFSFRGLPLDDNVYWIHAGPPWGEGMGLISSEPFTIVVPTPPSTADVVITLPHAFKTVTGHVYDIGIPPTGVPDAEIHAWRLDGPGFSGTGTDATGAFTLSLTGGEWHLGVEPSTPPAEWIFPGPPAWVVFDHDTTPQAETVDLEVIPTNAWVEGRIVCPGGGVCPGDPPYQDIWVELRNDDIHNDAGLGPDYRFSIPIPDGWYELVVHVQHPDFQGPQPVPVFVGPGGRYDVGDVELLPKDARIKGQVRNEMGAGVGGVPVVGWQPEGFGRGWAETDAGGFYDMPVIPGEWFVEPQPRPEQPYVFNQHPQLVRVAPGGEMTGVDFRLSDGSARIEGAAVDADSYEHLWGLDGWSWAERLVAPGDFEFYSDAPMWDGSFELKVMGDEVYNVGLNVPPHAPYVSGGTGPVSVPPAAHVPIAVPLEHKDAVIEGRLVIAGTPTPALGVWAEVFGEDERGHWVGVGVDPDSAWYELGVVAGTWHLRAWVDPASGYVADPATTLVPIQSGGLASVDFEVWPINALISGRVLAPDGTGLHTFVFAEGESPHVGYFETYVESDENGNYELLVPEGGYVVGAALPGDELEARGWMNPLPIDVPWVSVGSPAAGQDLRFRRLDGEIHGTVTFAPGIAVTPSHPAYVWGWTDSGEWTETEAMTSTSQTFTYTMRVISDTVWHVGAVYEDWDNGVFYESPEMDVPVLPPSGQATQDLALGGPWPLPQPFIVSFDGTQMQTIQLFVPPDRYLELNIPPGALVNSGTVTLFIFPTRELRPEAGHEIVGVGYEMWAIDGNGQEITHFNHNVAMTFPYPSDAELASLGVPEQMLVPVYYSTLLGHWILADSYVVDTVNNEITLHISHFTKFGVASAGRPFQIYLPIVFKSFQ